MNAPITEQQIAHFLAGYWRNLARTISDENPDTLMDEMRNAQAVLSAPLYTFLVNAYNAALNNAALRAKE